MTNHLLKSFRRLRTRREWLDRVYGGIYVLELTNHGKGWHVHIHIIAMMRYFPQHWLSRLWLSVSGSPIVDIRSCKDRNPYGYVTKYITKCEVPALLMPEVETCLKNRRLWSPFGFCHSLNLQYRRPAAICPKCGGTDWITHWLVDHALDEMHAHPG